MKNQQNPVKKVGEFVLDGMVFVVCDWQGKPAAYIPECCGIVELSGWGRQAQRKILEVWNNRR